MLLSTGDGEDVGDGVGVLGVPLPTVAIEVVEGGGVIHPGVVLGEVGEALGPGFDVPGAKRALGVGVFVHFFPTDNNMN